jgi:hypothetical protein
MVIVKLAGGLGNQMFQYAFGKTIAHRQADLLKLDMSFFDEQTLRRFELGDFDIQAEAAEARQTAQVRGRGLIRRLTNTISGGASIKWVREKGFEFDSSMSLLQGNLYLDGYWQSEKYFDSIADVIRREFTLKEKRGHVSRVAKVISGAANAVSLHVRRGDYVENQSTNAFHGTCPLEYYSNAVALIKSRFGDAHIFVFSDEPVWARENLGLAAPVTVVSDGDLRPAEEMHLMSCCQHHIIANSTFSWWGAWLNEHPEKMVIAPKRWFSNLAIDTKDLLPERWIRI